MQHVPTFCRRIASCNYTFYKISDLGMEMSELVLIKELCTVS